MKLKPHGGGNRVGGRALRLRFGAVHVDDRADIENRGDAVDFDLLVGVDAQFHRLRDMTGCEPMSSADYIQRVVHPDDRAALLEEIAVEVFSAIALLLYREKTVISTVDRKPGVEAGASETTALRSWSFVTRRRVKDCFSR